MMAANFVKHWGKIFKKVILATTPPIIIAGIRRIRRIKEPTISEKIINFVISRKGVNIPQRPCSFEKQASLIVPCYRHEVYLETTFKSIISQTYRPFEVIFVNDCSPDNTQNILEKLFQNIPADISYKILRLPRNVGQSESINLAIRSTQAQVIMILNDDDYLMHDALEVALKLLKIHQDIFMIGAPILQFRDDSDLQTYPKYIKDIVGSREIQIRKQGPSDALKFESPYDINMAHSSVTFFRYAWESVGGYFSDKSKRIHIASDRDFQMRVCSMFPVGVSLIVPFAFWREENSVDQDYS